MTKIEACYIEFWVCFLFRHYTFERNSLRIEMSETESTQVSAVFEDVAKFDASALKKVDIAEKTLLPSLEGIKWTLLGNNIFVN